METLVEMTELYSGYDGLPVVRDVSLNVKAGEIVGLLGANGAGKSTTLLTLSGLIKPLGGRVTVLGQVPSTRRPHVLARSGVAHVTESRNLFHSLTVEENLRLAVFCGRRQRRTETEKVLDIFPALRPLLRQRAGVLSGGEQQMLSLARALIGKPRVMLLDELSLGLAPILVERLLRRVREIADDTSCGVILVEQHVHLALRIIDRGYIMSNGRIAMQGSATELAADREVLESSYLGDIALHSGTPTT
jgi:branched-chain amino acid transport system ATP-binding protein